MTDGSADLEITDLSRAIVRGVKTIAICAGVGLVAAALVLAFAPVRFDGRAMILARTKQASVGGVVREQFGALAHLAGDALGLGEGGDPIKTEMALLQSRALLGDVVDSLALQLRQGRVNPLSLGMLPPAEGRFAPRKINAGDAGMVKVVDREDAIDDLRKRLTVRIYGGETIEISYRSRDSLSAELVPNLVAQRYLERRRTVDRGLNQRRAEFLEAQVDSVRRALSEAVDVARQEAQRGAGVAAEAYEASELEQRTALQLRLAETRAELGALEALLRDVAANDPQRIAGFPALLRSPAVNELVAELGRRETERTLLRASATDRDPRVQALGEAIEGLRAQLVPMALTYAGALARQQDAYEQRIAESEARGRALPASAARALLAQVEVERLTKLHLALGAQLLEARLAALGEGGDVRIVDRAVAPRKVSFPRRGITLAVGLAAGLALGLILALIPLMGARPAES
ncbi:MAG: hypothetical protein KF689_05345 [Gemmatimonadaceae bacterium]|nr:hypothetical protein [Gemmatimonadaceae bacterium]MCW5825401.1 hypothetical protein [Gemmatimonadaceae bacterium]